MSSEIQPPSQENKPKIHDMEDDEDDEETKIDEKSVWYGA